MSHAQVAASAGWQWITQGWYLFTRKPGMWVLLALILAVIYILLSWIPLLGPIAAAVLAPALFGGLVHGARELDAGRNLESAHIFQAIRDSSRTGPMLALGMVPLAASVLMTLFTVVMLTGAEGLNPVSGLLYAVIAVGVALATAALLLFAIPRVLLGQAVPFDAIQQSAVAVRDNLGAFLVLIAVYAVLSIIAAIPFGLGFLIVLPVMAGAVHAAHREIFGDDLREA